MACRLVAGTVQADLYTAGGDIDAGAMVYQSSNTVVEVDGSTETQATIVGVAPAAITSGSVGEVIVATDDQVWEIDCANNTATAQLLENHLMTSGGLTVNNLDTESTVKQGVVNMLAIRGAAADKKARFRIVRRTTLAVA